MLSPLISIPGIPYPVRLRGQGSGHSAELQLQIYNLLRKKATATEISEKLNLSFSTADNYLRREPWHLSLTSRQLEEFAEARKLSPESIKGFYQSIPPEVSAYRTAQQRIKALAKQTEGYTPRRLWMHGSKKQRIRQQCLNHAQETFKFKTPIQNSLAISLPYTRFAYTTRYFNQFPHVNKPRYLFFEDSSRHLKEMGAAFLRWTNSTDTTATLTIGDILQSQGLISRKVAIFDLDLMAILSRKNAKRILKTITLLCHPNGFYAFINTSMGRAITKKEAEDSLKWLKNSLSRQLNEYNLDFLDFTYRDSSPMIGTSLIGQRKPI